MFQWVECAVVHFVFHNTSTLPHLAIARYRPTPLPMLGEGWIVGIGYSKSALNIFHQ
jgi:hypothetical protein